jgi:outer membrane protein assembly factor BamB
MKNMLSVFSFSLILLASVVFPKSENVFMFRGNSALTGVYNSKPVNTLDQVQFVFKTNGAVRSTPVIVDGVLYIGSNDGNLYAMNSNTGAKIWQFKTNGAVTSTAAVVNGIVWFTSRDDYFYALDAKSGKEIWKFKMGKDLSNSDYQDYWDYYLSSPNINDGKVYVGSGDGNLYAFECKTRKKLWKFDAKSRIRSTPAIKGNSVVFGTMDGHLISVNKSTGKLQWRFATDGASINFDNRSNDRTSVFCSPSIGDGIVTVGGRDGFIYGVNFRSGNLEWKTTHDSASWILSMAIDKNTVYIGSGSAFILQAAELQTGKEIWRFKTKSAVFSSISVTGNTLYFADMSGSVYALERTTGMKEWEFAAGTRIFSTPVVSGGMIYFGSDDGNVYALKGRPDKPMDRLPAKKIVYWEGPKSKTSFLHFQFHTDEWLRDYFVGAGYQLMNEEQLVNFIKNQDYKNFRSVIVLADNKIPTELIGTNADSSLLRKYLNDGGKVAAFGDNPLPYVTDPQSGQLAAFDLDLSQKILGVALLDPRYSRGYYPSCITAEGKKWGLRGFWVGSGFVIDPDQATNVLAVNEFGKATTWLKNYDGSKGTGWLQLTVNSYKGIIGELVYQCRSAIEYGIEW